MKTLIKIAASTLIMFMAAACSTPNQISSNYYDDGVYSSSKRTEPQKTVKNDVVVKNDNTADYIETKPKKYQAAPNYDKSQYSYQKYKENQAQQQDSASYDMQYNDNGNNNYSSSFDEDDYYEK